MNPRDLFCQHFRCAFVGAIFLLPLSAAEHIKPEADAEGEVMIGARKASNGGLILKLKNANLDQQKQLSEAALLKVDLKKDENFDQTLVTGLMHVEPDGEQGGMTAGEIEKAARDLQATGLYEYVEPDWIVTAQQLPTDSAFTNGALWGLRNTGQNGGTEGVDINVVPAWALTEGVATVVVGVVDSGIRFTHQDLAANMWRNSDEIPGNGIDDDANGYIDDIHGINAITNTGNPMDDNNHGTHCAGTIAASANDAGQHVGVAHRVKLMGLKFLSSTGSGSTSDAIECINYGVANGAHILSNSWGGGSYSQALRDAIAAANAAGVLFVAAAGNSSANNDVSMNYPSNYDPPNVLAVAAVDRTGALASFSSYGRTTVDVGAPGVAILSCTAASDTSYASFDGTSMATPHVSGVAALIKSLNPSATVAEIKSRIMSTTRPLSSLAGRTASGGIVNTHAALTAAADGVLEIQAAASSSPLRNGVVTSFYVSVSDLSPVTGATVTGTLTGGSSMTFLDNGVAPDLAANDGVYSVSTMVTTSASTANLNVSARLGSGTPQTGIFPFSVISPPINDLFANRILLSQGTTQATGSNSLATFEVGEPRNPSVAGSASVWWEWVSGTTGSVVMTTSGSSFDTTLAVYSGSGTLASLTALGSNDDFSGVQSQVTFSSVSGSRYYIQVNGYGSSSGSIVLNYPSPMATNTPPVILAHPQAQQLVVGEPLSLTVSAAGAGTLTYQWMKDSITIPGAATAAYAKTASESADAGSYSVIVSNAFGSATSNGAFVSIDPVSVRPINDAFADAIELSGTSGRVSGTNVRASAETGEPNHGGASSPMESVWYRWTAPADGVLSMDTYGSTLNTVLAIYTGSSVSSLVAIGANDNAGSPQSFVSVNVTAGQTYRIAVDGSATLEGIFSLNHYFQVAVAGVINDNIANRTVLAGTYVTAAGTNVGAGGESGEPNHATGSAPFASVWWSWTAPISGTVVVDTLGSDFDTTLAVYQGGTIAELLLVAENADAPGGTHSRVAFSCTAGQTYSIAVDGADAAEGAVAFRISAGATQPEISVEQPTGTPLIDGVSSLSYGTTVPNALVQRTFTIRNLGGASLGGLRASLSGSGAASFVVTSQPTSVVGAGLTSSMIISFQPPAVGTYSATLHLSSNDENEHPFDITLTGTAVPPVPEISLEQPTGTSLVDGTAASQFGNVYVGSNRVLTYSLRNLGTATLTGLSASVTGANATDFTVSAIPSTISAGSTSTFTVTFVAGAIGARSANLQITSNDVDENPFDVNLVGTGLAVSPVTTVSLFASPTHVDTTGELVATRAMLTNLGYQLHEFTGILAADWAQAFAVADVVVVPELERASLPLDATARATINSRLTAGKGLIVMGTVNSNAAAFINSLNGWGLTYGTNLDSGSMSKSATVPGFVNSPPSLAALNAVYLLNQTSLPVGAQRVYDYQTFNAVFHLNQIGYIGYDGYAGANADWTAVLGDMIRALLPVIHPVREIEVSADGVGNLTDGVSLWDFGAVAKDAATVKSLTIRNTGATELTGLSCALSGADAAVFQIVMQPPASLAPGTTATVNISCLSNTIGIKNASLQISSNDEDENPFDLNLQADVSESNANTLFRITSLTANGAVVVNHDSLTGDDRGGIALSASKVFVSGDTSTANYSTSLTGGVAMGRVVNGLCHDLQSGKVYSLALNGTEIGTSGTLNQLIRLDSSSGARTSEIIALSQSISFGSGSGVFSGYGRIVIYTSGRLYDIESVSGRVTDLGLLSITDMNGSETWASWGVAEYFNGAIHLAYRPSTGNTIKRYNVSTRVSSVIATFTDLGDMASWTVAPTLGRWYFHYESSSQFGSYSEALGYATATFQIGNPTAPPVISSALTQSARIGEQVSYQITASNFPDTYSAVNLPTGLTINSSGLISGTVTTPGEYVIQLSATNAAGTGNAEFILTITSTPTVIADDFDPTLDSTVWAAFGGTITTNTHGAAAGGGSTGNSLHFNGTGSRFALTRQVDTRAINALRFRCALGSISGSPTWDAVEVGKELVLEYTTNGVTFVRIGLPYSNRVWQEFVVAVPAAAKTPATQFRWRQLSNSGMNFDHCAIEDVFISSAIEVQPEIAVEYPVGTSLTDGISQVNFGTSEGGVPIDLSFTIRNAGSATLSGLSVTIQGADASQFTLTSAPPTSLGSGTSGVFTITYAPTNTSSHNATIAISSNDADENPFDISITGDRSNTESVAISAEDRGWYRFDGTHTTTNSNYIIGWSTSSPAGERRSFFLYQLGSLLPGERYVQAELRLDNPSNGYSSPNALESIQIMDVSTPHSLITNGTAGVSGFNDLGNGVAFSSPKTVSSADNGRVVVIPLNTEFLRAVNQSPAGGRICIGGMLNSLSGTPTVGRFIFGFTSDTQRTILVLRKAPNTTPTFSGYTASTGMQRAAAIAITKILSQAADADGDALQLSAVSATSLHGGTAVLRVGQVLYTPPAGFRGIDRFSVTITDAYGGSVTGQVTMNVGQLPSDGGIGANPPNLRVVGGATQLTWNAIPGRTYIVQKSVGNLNDWITIATVTADSAGVIRYTDSSALSSSAFYRFASP